MAFTADQAKSFLVKGANENSTGYISPKDIQDSYDVIYADLNMLDTVPAFPDSEGIRLWVPGSPQPDQGSWEVVTIADLLDLIAQKMASEDPASGVSGELADIPADLALQLLRLFNQRLADDSGDPLAPSNVVLKEFATHLLSTNVLRGP